MPAEFVWNECCSRADMERWLDRLGASSAALEAWWDRLPFAVHARWKADHGRKHPRLKAVVADPHLCGAEDICGWMTPKYFRRPRLPQSRHCWNCKRKLQKQHEREAKIDENSWHYERAQQIEDMSVEELADQQLLPMARYLRRTRGVSLDDAKTLLLTRPELAMEASAMCAAEVPIPGANRASLDDSAVRLDDLNGIDPTYSATGGGRKRGREWVAEGSDDPVDP